MATATVAVGGIDNNQPKGAVEERTAAAMVMVAETMAVTVAAKITTLMPTLMTAHQ